MRRIRNKSLPENCIRLTPASYARIMAIANESRRPAADLLASAIAIFATAISDINLMHPAKLTARIRPKEQRSTIAPIGASVQRTVRKLTKGKQL